MTIEDIREIGMALGIYSVQRYYVKEDLVRVIQLSMGKTDCFERGIPCQNNYCEWRDECTNHDASTGHAA